MKKPILIGYFFLAFAFGTGIYHYLSSRKPYRWESQHFMPANDEFGIKTNPGFGEYLLDMWSAIISNHNFLSSVIEGKEAGLSLAFSLALLYSFQPVFATTMEGNTWLNVNLTKLTHLFQGPEQSGDRIKNNARANEQFVFSYQALWLGIAVVIGILCVYLLFQVRKKKAMAEQLNLVRADYDNLFNNAPCGYHSIDGQGYFININNTLLEWLEYDRHEVLGKLKFSDVVQEAVTEKISRLIKHKDSKVELNLIKKSGGNMPVILRLVRTESSRKDMQKPLYSASDNSEGREALEKIKYLDQELEAFSYSISHDLRAPLRSIDGYSKILQEDYTSMLDEDGKRVLNVIMSNARRMGKLIDDLLDFGRLGRKELLRSKLNMTGMVNHIVHELQMNEPDRKIDVKVQELHSAFADADMIRQVWFNLLENAFKYTGKKDRALIEVRSYKTGEGEFCYEVKDNGVGFDMKYAPKLFGVFQRLHKMQDFSGTGVGLAIVKRIISRHGGRVWAEGSLHEGAIFFFTIPIENENT